MTNLSQPQSLDTDHLTREQCLVLVHLIQGGLTRTQVGAALFGSDGSEQQDKACRARLRDLLTRHGLYVRGPGRPGPKRDALNALNALALGA